jgi:tetratricopeptide (TPR) repeat protein
MDPASRGRSSGKLAVMSRSRRPRVRKRAVAVVVALACAGALLAPLVAEGQKSAPAKSAPVAQAAKAPRDGGDRYDPDNVTAISQHMETLVKGNERYAAKDFNGALDLYKKAVQLNPKHPLGPYLVGEAYLALDNLPEAEAAFKQAAELNDPRNPQFKSHALFALADCYERQKKWTEARAAWQAYTEHAAKFPDGGAFPQSGAARIKAIDDYVKLDQAYAIVRERIANEKKDAGATPPKK